ncbi:hypothetical protein V6N12_019423 [Hibiscus sabdariffa]|uniref:Uncharacterized protein n=1 Tax=Hibiscus sabdariffa TaxID=183260 RepID=A0ABR2BM87_9ROSI
MAFYQYFIHFINLVQQPHNFLHRYGVQLNSKFDDLRTKVTQAFQQTFYLIFLLYDHSQPFRAFFPPSYPLAQPPQQHHRRQVNNPSKRPKRPSNRAVFVTEIASEANDFSTQNPDPDSQHFLIPRPPDEETTSPASGDGRRAHNDKWVLHYFLPSSFSSSFSSS